MEDDANYAKTSCIAVRQWLRDCFTECLARRISTDTVMPQLLPSPGCYRRAPGVRIVAQGGQTFAIVNYPLRVIRLNENMMRILVRCETEHTCEQLAHALHLPIKRVEAYCD